MDLLGQRRRTFKVYDPATLLLGIAFVIVPGYVIWTIKPWQIGGLIWLPASIFITFVVAGLAIIHNQLKLKKAGVRERPTTDSL